MSCNVGSVDRTLRLLIGFGAVALGVFSHSWWGALGMIPLLTAGLKWCPLYRIFGLSSCPMKTK